MSAPGRRRFVLLPALPVPATTGGEIYNHQVAAALASGGARIATFADVGVDATVPPLELAAAVVAWIARHDVSPGPVLEDTYLFRNAALLRRALRARGFGPFTAFGQALYPDRYRSPIVRARLWWRLARYLHRFDGHVVVSHAMRDAYARLGISRARVEVVYPGFDLVERGAPSRPREERGSALRIVTAGTYMPAKGQLLVVEALERLCAARPDLAGRLRFEAYGSRTQVPEYVVRVGSRAARLPMSVSLNGAVPQDVLWSAFSRSDVFAFPAAGEGLGMVVLEAMLCGCVPVVADEGPLPELVGRDGTAGLVVPRRAGSVALALERLVEDPTRLRALAAGAAARAASIARSWPETVAAFLAALDRLEGPHSR